MAKKKLQPKTAFYDMGAAEPEFPKKHFAPKRVVNKLKKVA